MLIVTDLDPVLYYFQVRAIDRSNNVQTSAADPTAVDADKFPEAGWSNVAGDYKTATPTLIGAADVAFNSVLTSILTANEINADDIEAGTLSIGGLPDTPDFLLVYNTNGQEIGRWDQYGLLIVDPANTTRAMRLRNGVLSFTNAYVGPATPEADWSTALSADGISADAIKLGTAPGGHNAMPNASFELSAFGVTLEKLWDIAADWGATIGTNVNVDTGAASLSMTTVTYAGGSPPTDNPPTISSIVKSNVTQYGFTVSWHVDEVAQGWVEYGLTTAYGQETAHENSFNYQDHSQSIAGLDPNTTYHFRIHAVDTAAQETVSADQTQTTATPTVTRPFAAPVTTATYNVPGTIDATGATDVQAALNSWIATVPNGSAISFPSTATYKLSKGLLFANRNNLVLNGNGCHLNMSGIVGSDEAASVFLMRGSSHIAIANFTVDGSNAGPYTSLHGENTHCLGLSGWYGGGPSSYIEMANVTGTRFFGDAAYLEGQNVSPYAASSFVWIHDCSFDNIGRNGVSYIDVTDVTIERCTFNGVGMDIVDIEPNFAGQTIKRCTFKNNTCGVYGRITSFEGWFLNTWNIPQIAPEDITLDTNTVVGNPSSGYSSSRRGLDVNVDHAGRPQRITIINNSTGQQTPSAPMQFFHVDTVRVQGNTQPLDSGVQAAFTDCTSVTFP